ncbi:MAG: Sec-independent protein translocase protein TatC [Verrucomicrobiae bacterium]|nr:Sec-independent protein translocase protein TatC [Verrucomicrobiae bacterium]
MPDATEPELLPPADETPVGGETKSFLDHLEDLRWMLIKMAATLAIAMLGCFLFAPALMKFFTHPLATVAGDVTPFLRTQQVTGGFMLAIKLALYAGLVVSSPILLYFLTQFVLPALTRQEKRMVTPVLLAGVGLFLCGITLCYFGVLPAALRFFLEYNKTLDIRSDWLIENYIGFVSQMMLAFGICFELPLVVLALAKIGIVTAEFLRQKRPYAIVLIFIVAAVITPTPDMLTQCLLAIPMCGLYEACVWIAWWMERRR